MRGDPNPKNAGPFSLRRWAQRKLDAARAEAVAAAPAATPANPPATNPPATTATPALQAAEQPVLPPIESLTIDSDFTLFMQPNVDAAVRRAALKQLFRDPRFNVMDGLDTYIDDYTKADPIPNDMLADLLERFDRAHAPTEAGDADAAREESAVARGAPSSDAASVPAAVASEEALPRTSDMSNRAEPTTAPSAELPRASTGESVPPSDAPTRGASG